MTNMIIYSIANIILLLLGIQIQKNELLLLSGKYNYKTGAAQWITFITAFIALSISVNHLLAADILLEVLTTIIVVLIFVVSEYLLAHVRPSRAVYSWSWRFAVTLVCTWVCNELAIAMGGDVRPVIPFIAAGFYLRNTPFGITHGKDLWIAHYMQRNPDIAFDDNADDTTDMPDCSFAGMKRRGKATTVFDVTAFGIVPNSSADQTEAIQRVIDAASKAGGGKVYFPKGRYLINTKGDKFLQINHSDITLEGATDKDGRPVAELVNCGKTARGHKNPWISPFMITTGEHLQPSNEFWGLQFRKKKEFFNRSNSLSDPGSDGTILTPKLTTKVIAPAAKGESVIHVEDSSKVGKYIMIGMYNTTDDGNLIHDILGIALRREWTVANRAGEEEAPSYQWLVEVKKIIDSHAIELVRPLLRDCDMKYEPAVFNVDMLENICICNLLISSRWTGLFRHHGFPLYYSITKTQEMDYGWNAINMKRVAHGEVRNVIIKNFSNPLYVMDSRNVTVSDILIKGYDGHQGLKIYAHACDNLFENIIFENHYADMMGGEGNAYANVFRNICYLNAVFKPVDYDFHGFSEAPMSPPSDNVFTRIYGFRYMKSAGAISHLPSCAQNNTWWDTITEGEKEGDHLFYAMTYRQKKGLVRFITAVGFSVAMIQKNRDLSPGAFLANVRGKLESIDKTGSPRSEHYRLYFPKSRVRHIKTTGKLPDSV